jgi:hypothetical protein
MRPFLETVDSEFALAKQFCLLVRSPISLRDWYGAAVNSQIRLSV